MIALSGQFSPRLAERLAAYEHVTFGVPEMDPTRVRVLVTRGALQVDADLLARLSGLELIVKAGSGLDNIDLAAASQRGVQVKRTGGSERGVAELAVALMFACARKVPLFDACMRKGDWSAKAKHIGWNLQGRKIGILGLGAIGREMALMSHGLGLSVSVLDRSPQAPEKQAAIVQAQARICSSVAELVTDCNVLSLHAPLTPQTRSIIGTAQLDLLARGAILINTARAELVAREALWSALRDGRLAAAGLDVHYQERLDASDPIAGLPNVVCTPHVGAQTTETHEIIADRVAAAVEAWAQAAGSC